jgi:probable HAF family extracellular repeat protein
VSQAAARHAGGPIRRLGAQLATALLMISCGSSTATTAPATPPPNVPAAASPWASSAGPVGPAATAGVGPRFGTPIPSVVPTLPPAPTPTLSPAATLSPATCPTPKTYTVVPGDTLTGIAVRAGVTLLGLIAANPQIRDPGLIRPGDRIVISPIKLGIDVASDINDRGEVAGTKDGRAVLWKNGTATRVGGAAFVADAVNNSGQVVGTSHGLAVLWQGGVVTDLGTLGGHLIEVAAVNDRGQVVGSSEVAGGDPSHIVIHAFLWQNGRMTDLGALNGTGSEAAAINDGGQVVGTSDGHAFLWQNGRMTDLGALNGKAESLATGVNDEDQVVGWSGSATEYGDAQAFLWQDGAMTALPTLAGGTAIAEDINDRGQIVGVSWTDLRPRHPAPLGGTLGHAALWEDGEVTDLGTLAGDEVSWAYRVNECRQVLGTSGTHAVLWQIATR